ncbi:MAG: S8 family serine peptidase [Chloroflexi bacterium]|nr:S8 family serine peptidase [Chloroflexota bacterium]
MAEIIGARGYYPIRHLPEQFQITIPRTVAVLLPTVVLVALIASITFVSMGIANRTVRASGSAPIASTSSGNAPERFPQGAQFVSGELLITFQPPKAGPQIHTAGLAAEVFTSEVTFDTRLGTGDTWVAQVAVGTELAAASTIAKDPRVKYAEPNYIYWASDLPDDPRFSELWGLNNTGQTGGTVDADIDAPEAWDITTGTSSVVVAVIDTGVNYLHEDLDANMWVNPGEIAGNGIDDDLNGHIDDIHGIDTRNGDSDPMDDNGHGSHVAGTVGAVGNNALGVSGVAQNVSIMALKFLSSSGGGSTDDAITAFQYVIDMKQNHGVNIKVTQNSWGGGGFSQGLSDVVNQAGALGILTIAAAGNSGTDNDVSPHYPSSFDSPYMIAVAASDHNDQRASFSQYGSQSVDIAAPGTNILSTVLGNNYGIKQGTSMATPQVSGIAALIASQHPTSSPAQIRRVLLNSIDALPAWESLVATGGRANAHSAVINDGSTSTLIILGPDSGSVAYSAASTTLKVEVLAGLDIVSGATVSASFSSGDPLVTLKDNGGGVDATSGDGVYSGVWSPTSSGDVVVTFTAGGPGISTSTRSLPVEVRHSDAPTNVVAIAGDAQATVAWDPPINPGSTSTQSYVVVSIPAGGGTTTPASVTTTTVIGLTNGTSYTFVVKAINGLGSSASSTPSNAVTPRLPSDIRVTSTPISLISPPWATATRTVTVFNDGPGQLTLSASIPAQGQGIQGTGGPDGYGYTYEDSDAVGGPVFNWIDITGTGVPITSGDNIFAAVPIGFDFEFYGIKYNALYVGTNGIAGFASTSMAEFLDTPLPTATTPNNLIAAFWEDLTVPSADQLLYELQGLAPNRELIVTWDQAISALNSSHKFSFQIVLSESSNRIKIQYGSINGDVGFATVGIENVSGTVGLEVARFSNYVKDSLAVLISPPEVTVDPATAVIEFGSSTELSVTLNGFVHPIGTSSRVLRISSNDPDEATIDIPLELEVTAGPPDSPTEVLASPRVSSAIVTWIAPANDGGAPVSLYTLVSSPGGLVATTTGATTSVVVVGLADATLYTFTVTASNHDATSIPSSRSNAVAPFERALVVDSTADLSDASPGNGICLSSEGTCTLRAAIQESNSIGLFQGVQFNIPVTDPGYVASTTSFEIRPLSSLPQILDPLLIDGYSQPGAVPSTSAKDLGLNGVIKIALVGDLAGASSVNGLSLQTSKAAIRGLSITGFSGDGILLGDGAFGSKAFFHLIDGNYIGVDVTGNAGTGNSGHGIRLENDFVQVGGPHPAESNLISLNGGSGILIIGTHATSSDIQGNFIGTNAAGSSALGNLASGITFAAGPTGITIGSANAGGHNVISGNGQHGIEFAGTGPAASFVFGNYIGINAAGTAALANAIDGISVINTSQVTIGGSTTAHGNVISGNGRAGVAISGATAGPNSLWNNTIGSSPDRTIALPNANAGVLIKNGASGNVIGGGGVTGNVIAFNGGDGVRVLSSNAPSSTANSISSNSIYSNSGIGIDLAIVAYDLATCTDCPGDGVTQNDGSVSGASIDVIHLDDDVYVLRDGQSSRSSQIERVSQGLDVSVEANNAQPFPVITSVSRGSSDTTISGTFAGVSTSTYRLEFFSSAACDVSGYGEGETFLASMIVTTDGVGSAAFSATVPSVLASDLHVTATATDSVGNTSEFSACSGGPVLNITVKDAVGDPVEGAEVFIYDADSTSKYPLTEGRFLMTDANGRVLVNSLTIASTGTVLISAISASPNLALQATSSLTAIVTLDPSSATEVVFTAIDVDGGPLSLDSVRASARDAWTRVAGTTNSSGTTSVLMTPGKYQLQFWSSDVRYVFVFPDVTIHPTTTSFGLDSRVIGTGEIGVDFSGDFDDLFMFPVHERSLTFPFMNPANGEMVRLSPGTWGAFVDLQKQSGNLIWRYSVNIWDDLAVTDGSIATSTTGGTFQASLSPTSTSFALGASPVLNLSVQDGFGHAMRGVFTTDPNFGNLTTRFARLTVTDPNGVTFVDVQDATVWASSYTVNLPAGAASGPYTAVLTFNSHQGTTTATTTFQVGGWDFGDAPDQKYPSSAASNGVRHALIDPIRLGPTNTGEPDAISSDGDSDDGLVSSDTELIISVVNDSWFATSTGAMTNGSGVPLVYLNVLIDWDEDGDWQASQDWAIQNLPIALNAGASLDLSTGITLPLLKWIRITVSDTSLENYIGTGLINAGETEDYFFYRTPSLHDSYFSAGHESPTSWVHAAGLSRYHEPLLSVGGTHDARQSLAHDPFFSLEHDSGTSWIHDATYTNYHDPIVSGTGIDPAKYMAHDPFFSAAHDSTTSWVHDGGLSKWHDVDISALAGLSRHDAASSLTSRVHDGGLSKWHDVDVSALTGEPGHDAASSLGHDPFLSRQHDSGTSWIHDGSLSSFHAPAVSGITSLSVSSSIASFATQEFLGHDAFFSSGHDSDTSWIHDGALSEFHEPTVSSADKNFKFHEVSLSLGHDSFLSEQHEPLTSWTHDGAYSNFHDPIPSVWGGHDPVKSNSHIPILSTIHEPLESAGGNQHTVKSLRHDAFFSSNHDPLSSFVHDGAYSNWHEPSISALGYRDAGESLGHDPYLSAQHDPQNSWIHDGAYSAWHDPLLSTATGTLLHLATESLGHDAFFSVNHDPKTSWKHNGSDSFWHIPTISAATSSATSSRLTSLEQSLAHEAFFSNGHDPQTTWFHDGFVSGWQHPQTARDGHSAVDSLGHEPALSLGHDVLTSWSHEGSLSNWIAPPPIP